MHLKAKIATEKELGGVVYHVLGLCRLGLDDSILCVRRLCMTMEWNGMECNCDVIKVNMSMYLCICVSM